MKKLFALAALVCCFCLWACGSSSRGESPIDVVTKLYAALGAQEYEKAVDMMYFEGPSAEQDRQMMLEMLTGFIGPQMQKVGGVILSNFTEKPGKTEGDIRLEFETLDGTGKSGKDHAVCRKNANGEWKALPLSN